jgi:hypothetical protein
MKIDNKISTLFTYINELQTETEHEATIMKLQLEKQLLCPQTP